MRDRAVQDLRHWHKPDERPSQLEMPPPCCVSAAKALTTVAVRDGELALVAERRRIVTEALAGIGAYADAAVSLLDDDAAAQLVRKVAQRCADVVRAVGCICPQLDVSTLGEGPGTRFVPGRDPRCGVHGRLEADVA